jgi:hypothetical protein
MALTKAQREQRRVEEAYQSQMAQRQRAMQSPCRFHPDWQIPADHPTMHNPQASCPECAAEVIARRDAPPPPPRTIYEGSAGDELDLRYELHRQKHGEPTGQIEPGSFAEEDALQKIFDARVTEETRHADKEYRGPRGVLISARPVAGKWIETWRVGNRLVRVGPD